MVKRIINIEKISKKENRLVCFSKRRNGLFKKAHELSALTGAQIAVLVLSESGRPYFHSSSPSFVAQFLNPEFSLPAGTSSPSPASAESSSGGGVNEEWLRYLLDFEVQEVDVEELMAVKEKLEEMRERAAMALDWSFANSLLLSGDFDHDSLPPNDNVDDSSCFPVGLTFSRAVFNLTIGLGFRGLYISLTLTFLWLQFIPSDSGGALIWCSC